MLADSNAFRDTIKAIMKREGVTYSDLSNRFGLTTASKVREKLFMRELTLEDAAEFAHVLGYKVEVKLVPQEQKDNVLKVDICSRLNMISSELLALSNELNRDI